jgi:hypothetical protein
MVQQTNLTARKKHHFPNKRDKSFPKLPLAVLGRSTVAKDQLIAQHSQTQQNTLKVKATARDTGVIASRLICSSATSPHNHGSFSA